MALAKLNRKHLTVDKTVDKYVPVDMNWHLDKQWDSFVFQYYWCRKDEPSLLSRTIALYNILKYIYFYWLKGMCKHDCRQIMCLLLVQNITKVTIMTNSYSNGGSMRDELSAA